MSTNTITESQLTLNDFDYALPEELIAKYPSQQRDQSKMLVLDKKTGHIQDKVFSEITSIIGPNDVLVLNNAKVMPVRLIGQKQGFTAEIEVFLLQPQNENKTQWHALIKNSKRLPIGSNVVFNQHPLVITVLEKQPDGIALVELNWDFNEPLETVLDKVGQMPIPPYMKRDAEDTDAERYQTVYAKVSGAQAAPTAGLHFTQAVLEKLKAQGTHIVELTLLVSAGTFKPVVANDVKQHKMSSEYYEISEEAAATINQVKNNGGKVFAVGTTVVKTLETVAKNNSGQVKAELGNSELFIYPGFDFNVVDVMLTNFHLPKSTLIMLVSAFANREIILNAYDHAVKNNYRFFSYGDCMLIGDF